MAGPQSQSELKEAFEEIAQSEARLRKILDTIPTLAFCNRADGSHEFINQRWHDYTGLSAQEASGAGWEKSIHSEDLPKKLRFRRE